MKKKLVLLLGAMSTMFILSGCGTKATEDMSYRITLYHPNGESETFEVSEYLYLDELRIQFTTTNGEELVYAGMTKLEKIRRN